MNCSVTLQMEDVLLADAVDPVHGATFTTALQQNNLNFGFDNGRVRGVCHSSHDPLWVVNIKKGVLSAFQQSVPSWGSPTGQVGIFF